MATLLHIDSSVFPTDASSSRAVTDAFRRTWQEQH
ncbi:MAG: FMN-dependent NADH-azoreductase, partial [Streptomyces sp.]|nr:FMN-dependent NADH-azoreductase [Streptomyces sp.]